MRTFIRWGLVVLLAISLSLSVSALASAQEKPLKLSFAVLPFYPEAVYSYALEKGIVKPKGIELEIKKIHIVQINRLILAGEVDLAEMSLGAYLTALAKGAKLKALAVYLEIDDIGNALFALAGSGIKEPKDLVGKKVGMPGPHSTTVYIRGLLEHKYGIKPDKITWVSKDIPQLRTMLDEKIVDATILFGDFALYAFRSDKYVPVITTARAWKEMTGSLPVLSPLVIKEEVLIKNPEVADALMEAFRKSHEYGRQNVKEITEAYVKEKGGDPDYLISTLKSVQVPLTATDQQKKSIEIFMNYSLEQGLLEQRVDLTKFFYK